MIVDFKNSSLSHIPNVLFDTFINLDRMIASTSNLMTIGNLRNCSNLKSLEIYDNYLRELPLRSISACSNLEIIGASVNQIRELEPDLLLNFRHIRHVDLSYNQISILKEGSLATSSSHDHISLFFNNNPITTIESEFNKTATFQFLGFSNCKIFEIIPNFLTDFSGEIRYLEFLNNLCINRNFQAISSENVAGVALEFSKCFENFNASPPTAPTPQPTVPSNSGKMICTEHESGKFYDCEADLELLVINRKNFH